MVFLAFLVAGGAYLVFRGTTPEERRQFVDEVLHPAALRIDAILADAKPFRATLRARTPRLIATPVLAGLNVLMFLAMLFGDGSFDSYATLIDWGVNHGPRTTNGEWWRLVTAMFVHGGPFHLLFILIGLLQVAELLERLLGGPIVAGVYLCAGMFAGLVSLVDQPLAIHAGASASIYGLFGLLLAVIAWSAMRPTSLVIPVAVYQTLLPATAVFFLYTFVTDGIANRPNLVGLVVGTTAGVAIVAAAGERRLPARRYAMGIAVAAAIMLAIALPLRGIADVRSDLIELVISEDRQATVFRIFMARFPARRVPIDRPAVATLIERTFVPQLTGVRARIARLPTALPDHQPLVAAATEYVRLREQSWRLRAEGLRSGKVAVLREADRTEMAARAAVDKLRTLQQTFAIYL